MNTAQDLFGYHFLPTDNVRKAGFEITNELSSIQVNLNNENNVAGYQVSYKYLDCLFYDKPANPNEAVK
jgi:hypothetical protein